MTTPNIPGIIRIARRVQGLAFIPCDHYRCGSEARYWVDETRDGLHAGTGERCTRHTPKGRRSPWNRIFPNGLPVREPADPDGVPF